MDFIDVALPALGEAFTLIFTFKQIGWLMIGVLLGLCVGVFPGLGGIAGLSLVLPFIYGMDPVSGLAMMMKKVSTTAPKIPPNSEDVNAAASARAA